jgi:uncharacterized protein (DUF58 family)
MITKTGLCLLVIIVLSILLALGMRYLHFYVISSLGCGLLLVSFFISIGRARKLQINRQLPKASFVQEALQVKVDIENTSNFQEGPLKIVDFFTISDSKESEQSVFISDLEKTPISYNYQAVSKKRGVYDVGPFLVETTDLFGIFKVKRRLEIYSKLVAYPKPFDIRYLPIVGGVPSFGGEASRIAGDYEEFYGIREYKINDGLRKIHWPSTARTGELMVKQYEQSATYKTTIILDLNETRQASWDTEDSFEWAVNIAASVLKYLIDRKMHVQFIAEGLNSYSVPLKGGQAHFFEILESLAKVKADSKLDLAGVLDVYDRFIPSGSSVILIFSKIGPDIIERLMRLISRRIKIISIVMEDIYMAPQDALLNICSNVYEIKEADIINISSKFI